MKKILLILPIILAGCSKSESDLRIAVRTDCKYEKVAEQEYSVAKAYVLYNTDGTKDRDWEYRGFVGAASHEYICFDDFAIGQGCPESIMKKVSDMHEGGNVYCTIESQ